MGISRPGWPFRVRELLMYRTDADPGMINSVLDSLSWTLSSEWLSLKLKKQDLPLGDKSPRVTLSWTHSMEWSSL